MSKPGLNIEGEGMVERELAVLRELGRRAFGTTVYRPDLLAGKPAQAMGSKIVIRRPPFAALSSTGADR